MNEKTKNSETRSKKAINKMLYKPSKGEINDQDSLTIPNDTLSIRQLLINHSRGLGNLPHTPGMYTEEEVAPKYTDPLDRLRDIDNLKSRISQFEEAEKQAKTASQKAPAKEDLQASTEEPPADN